MFTFETTNRNSVRAQFICDNCGKTDWPLYRIAGYPTPEAYALVEAGDAVLKGCMVDENDMHDYECPHCEFGTEMPEGWGIDEDDL